LSTNENAARPISADVADWSREHKAFLAWQPGRSLLASLRAYQRLAGRRGPFAMIGRKIAVLRHRFWSVVSGADIPLNSQLGGGLLIPHPNGIVIHPRATVGVNCLIHQQVTIGVGGRPGDVPRIGGHVDIGAGAKILGGLVVGDHARVGANAVVLADVPTGATAVGIPARVISS
jgi:serine O-acetyltransferase